MAGGPRGATHRQLRVFVSSTSEDLQAYRAAARLAILDVGWMPTMMEHFGPVAQPTVKACRDAIANSDLVLLIVAHRRGWVAREDQDGNGKDSITALEMQHAKQGFGRDGGASDEGTSILPMPSIPPLLQAR
jgi:hypothetical protein